MRGGQASPCAVIPGLSSATAGPTLAGIPLTHRELGQSFCVLSGHLPPEHPDSRVNWPALAAGPDTLVLLMAVRNLRAIAAHLIACGRAETTPAACVERAARPGSGCTAARWPSWPTRTRRPRSATRR